MDALVVEELAEVENSRLCALEPGCQPVGVALVGEPLCRVGGVRRIATGLVEQVGERLAPILRGELLDVDARRHLVDAVDVADDVFEHGPDVGRAHEDGAGLLERLPASFSQLGAGAE